MTKGVNPLLQPFLVLALACAQQHGVQDAGISGTGGVGGVDAATDSGRDAGCLEDGGTDCGVADAAQGDTGFADSPDSGPAGEIDSGCWYLGECEYCSRDLDNCATSLECFCDRFHCDLGHGPFGHAKDPDWIAQFAGCNRSIHYTFVENPSISFLIDTSTNEIVGAAYADDSGMCPDMGTIWAGEPFTALPPSVPGCRMTSCLGCGSGF